MEKREDEMNASNEARRVLQVICRVENCGLCLFVGQQMDVFIAESDPQTAGVR